MLSLGSLTALVTSAPIFLLIAVRAFAMIQTAPVFSSTAIPMVAKVALAGCAAYCAFPVASVAQGWQGIDAGSLSFVFLVIGEGAIGIIIGFFITILFSAFGTAGQFFAFQMGFAMAESFDPLSQVENPLIGQFLNLVAMLIFIVIGGMQTLLLGFERSLQSLSIVSVIAGRQSVIDLLAGGLTNLFLDAATIAMPIMGTLFLVNLATGLIGKAAPQINIMTEGFPISIGVAFILMFGIMPFMVEAFGRVIDSGFYAIQDLFIKIGVAI
ncbi:MAG: flagellar biosynthetic protein FliR [Spirochaetaceae bacterium]|jgi:flagellar biosynthetic protein FliR|nr:flagellar biosynthetic protein FliR [Spirochaetaceae bacterium]